MTIWHLWVYGELCNITNYFVLWLQCYIIHVTWMLLDFDRNAAVLRIFFSKFCYKPECGNLWMLESLIFLQFLVQFWQGFRKRVHLWPRMSGKILMSRNIQYQIFLGWARIVDNSDCPLMLVVGFQQMSY